MEKAMRFRAVTISTIAVPPMAFEFEQPSVNAAMEFLCRSVPMMKGAGAAGYDFELYYLPEPGLVEMVDAVGVLPKLVGTTKTSISTRFVKNQGFSVPPEGQGEAKAVEMNGA